MSTIDYSRVPDFVWIDLCVMAIKGTAEAMRTSEGQAAVEKGKKEYLHHLAKKKNAPVKTGANHK